eukprot:5681-Heterococcus_DN1.PRE.4
MLYACAYTECVTNAQTHHRTSANYKYLNEYYTSKDSSMKLRARLVCITTAVLLATQQLECAADPFTGRPAAAAPCYAQTRACDANAACRACTIAVNKPAGGAPSDPVTCEKLLEFVSNTFPECDPSRTPAYSDLLNCFIEAMAVS